MTFLEAEFDRLDIDKSGEPDIREMAQSRLPATRHTSVGKWLEYSSVAKRGRGRFFCEPVTISRWNRHI